MLPVSGGVSVMDALSVGCPVPILKAQNSSHQPGTSTAEGILKFSNLNNILLANNLDEWFDLVLKLGTNKTFNAEVKRIILANNKILFEKYDENNKNNKNNAVNEWRDTIIYMLDNPRPPSEYFPS